MAKTDEILNNINASLGALYERTDSVIRELKDQNKHLEKINGTLHNHDGMITTLNTTVYGEKSDKGLVGRILELASNQKKLIIAVTIIAGAVGAGTGEAIRLLGG